MPQHWAIGVAALIASVNSEPAWQSWPKCKDYEQEFRKKVDARGAEPDGFTYCNSEALDPYKKWDAEDHQFVHKLIELEKTPIEDSDDYALKYMRVVDSVMLAKIKELGDARIYPIVIFGGERTGKSTLGNFLTCAVDCAHAGYTFQERKAVKSGDPNNFDGTLGMWVSPILEKGGKKFLIFDMEGLNTATKDRKPIITKMLAMMSEVASVFVFASRDEEEVTTSDEDLLSAALTTTREHLLKKQNHLTKEEAKNKEVVKATNLPQLIVVNRAHESSVASWVNEDLTYNYQHFADKAAAAKIVNNTEFKKILSVNFATADGKTDEDPHWTWIPAPNMDKDYPDRLFDFTWQAADRGQHVFHGCKLYSEMQHDCAHTDGVGPGRSRTYRVVLDALSDTIVDHAPLRMYRNVDGGEDPLTAKRFTTYLAQAVEEMNKVGPLPETKLWKRVIEEGCDAAIMNLIDQTLGSQQVGKKVGALKAVMDVFLTVSVGESGIPREDATQEAVADVLLKMDEAWNNGLKMWDVVKKKLFEDEPLYDNVMETCEQSTMAQENSYKQQYGMLLKSGKELFQTVRANKLQQEVDRLENEAWWEKNKWMMLIYVVLGCLACIVIAKICVVLKPVADCIGMCCSLCSKNKEPYPQHGQYGSSIEMHGRALRDPDQDVLDLVGTTQTIQVTGGTIP